MKLYEGHPLIIKDEKYPFEEETVVCVLVHSSGVL